MRVNQTRSIVAGALLILVATLLAVLRSPSPGPSSLPPPSPRLSPLPSASPAVADWLPSPSPSPSSTPPPGLSEADRAGTEWAIIGPVGIIEPGCEPLPKATLDRIVRRRASNAILSRLDIDRNEHFDVYERGPLPAVRLETWLLRELGPKVKLNWEANDCGCCEATANYTSYCQVPLCGEVTATLSSGVAVHLDLSIGTLSKGASGKPTLNSYGLRDRDGKEIRVYTFRALTGMARDLDSNGGRPD